MALALYGASALVLQHREQFSSVLGKPKEFVATTLLRSAVQTLSAALFLIYYVELSFRSRNLLAKQHWRDLGGLGFWIKHSQPFVLLPKTMIEGDEWHCTCNTLTGLPCGCTLLNGGGCCCTGLWATKLGFIVLSTHMLVYRCQQECDPRLFHTFEEHFYRTQWYVRLFAAAAATSNILLAGLLGTWSLIFRSEEEHPSKVLGTIPCSIAESLGLKEGLVQLHSNTAAAVVECINAVICPLILVYGLWALWLPQLPLLQWFYAPLI